jgi:hypothetical protein
MGNTNYALLPTITCPHCDKVFQLNDYYDIKTGDDFDCPSCEKTIHVLSVETILEARIGTEKEAKP